MNERRDPGPRALSQRDFDRFAALSGDYNPIHVDPGFARSTHFGATVAHGMFLYGLMCAASGRRLLAVQPAGWLPLTQTLMFPAPTYVGDTVSVELAESPDAMTHEAIVRNQQRQPTATGRAVFGAPAAGYRPAAVDDMLNRSDLDSDAELYGLALGQQASCARRFTDADLGEYIDLCGDPNPILRDDRRAAAVGLASRMLGAPMLGGMISELLGTRLPGRGTAWMKQSLAFHSPAFAGERLTATVTITRLRRDKQLVNLGCLIAADDGRSVATGEALALVRNLWQR